MQSIPNLASMQSLWFENKIFCSLRFIQDAALPPFSFHSLFTLSRARCFLIFAKFSVFKYGRTCQDKVQPQVTSTSKLFSKLRSLEDDYCGEHANDAFKTIDILTGFIYCLCDKESNHTLCKPELMAKEAEQNDNRCDDNGQRVPVLPRLREVNILAIYQTTVSGLIKFWVSIL